MSSMVRLIFLSCERADIIMVIHYNKLSGTLQGNTAAAESKLAQATKRLASGYRINSAADDAAGLAVSEKLRSIDRGLRQGIRNITDGIAYLDTVDGATQNLHDMMHRMKELAVEAANGTYDSTDRDALDLEYQSLLGEIEQITGNSDFNGIPLFQQHMPTYSMHEGAVVHDKPITIDGTNSDLVLEYTVDGETIRHTVHIPQGTYGVKQLADLIDDDLFGEAPELIIGVNDKNQFTLQCEGGKVESITGGGASLFYDSMIGNDGGYLLGVTHFLDSEAEMRIIEGKNNVMEFRVGYDDDTIYKIELKEGSYNREELISHINDCIRSQNLPYDVEALEYTNDLGRDIIALKGEKPITGLSGNFLLIDRITSPIYDITQQCTFVNEPGKLVGKKVLEFVPQTDADGNPIMDAEEVLTITKGRNDFFVIQVDYPTDDPKFVGKDVRIDLLTGYEKSHSFTKEELITKIQEQIDAADVPVKVRSLEETGGTLEFVTTQYGDDCLIMLKTSDVPSAHMVYDLFDIGIPSKTNIPIASKYSPAYLNGSKTLVENETDTIEIISDANTVALDVGFFSDRNSTNTASNPAKISITLNPKKYTADELVTALNGELAKQTVSIDGANVNCDKLMEFKIEYSKDNKNGKLVVNAKDGIGSSISSIKSDPTMYGHAVLFSEETFQTYYKVMDGEEVVLETPKPGATPPEDPSVLYKDGYDGEGDLYTDGYNYSTPRNEFFENTYEYNDYTIQDGSIKGTEGTVGGDGASAAPATLQIKNALAAFSTLGKSENELYLFLNINKDGKPESRYITFAKGMSREEAVEHLTKELEGIATVKADGDDLTIATVEKGDNIRFSSVYGSFMYKTELSDPASMTLSNAGENFKNGGFVIDSTDSRNQTLALKFNDKKNNDVKEINLTIPDGKYGTLSDFASKVNELLKQAYDESLTNEDETQHLPEITVEAKGSRLVFTAGENDLGEISINDDKNTCLIDKIKKDAELGGDLFWDPEQKKAVAAASIVVESIDLHFQDPSDAAKSEPMTVVADKNDVVTMTYVTPDGKNNKTITLKLSAGTYKNGNELADELNKQIKNNNYDDILAPVVYVKDGENKGLIFKTKKGGEGYKLTDLGGSANLHGRKVQFGLSDKPKKNTPAKISNDKINETVDNQKLLPLIIDGQNDKLALTLTPSVKAGSSADEVSFSINHGVYTDVTALIEAVKQAVSTDGKKLEDYFTVEYKNNVFSLTTITEEEGGTYVGKDAKIRISENNTSTIFAVRKPSIEPLEQNCVKRSFSTLMGNVKLADNINIDDNSTEMNLILTYPQTDGTTENTPLNIVIDKGDYTRDALVEAIQNKLDGAISAKVGEKGNGLFKVSMTGDNKLRISNINVVDKVNIKVNTSAGVPNGLYDEVLLGDLYTRDPYGEHQNFWGHSGGDSAAYIIGRNDLMPELPDEIASGKNIVIYDGLNDEVKFDYTLHKGDPDKEKTYSVEFKLPDGNYTPQELAQTFQEEARKVLKASEGDDETIPAEYFHATIGLSAIGVPETNVSDLTSADKLILSFTFPSDDDELSSNDVIIDGVRGNSSYRIFYDSSMVPCPTYFIGKPDLSGGITISGGVNDTLIMNLNDEKIEVKIPSGQYSCEELSKFFNDRYEDMDVPVRTMTRNGHLMFYTLENDDYSLSFSGNAANDIIYGAEFHDGGREEVDIHTGRRTGTYINIAMARVSAALMRINTTGLEPVERAIKALERLDNANTYLTRWRAVAGAYKNRSESALNRNTVNTENLESAESGIRDTDIALEYPQYVKSNVSSQIQTYLAQMNNQYQQSILNLLR